MKARLPVGIWIATLTVTAATLIISLTSGWKLNDYATGAATIAAFFTTLGAVITTRRPGNRVGVVLLALGAASALQLAFGQAAMAIGPGRGEAGWAMAGSELLRTAVFAGMLLLVLIFPTGNVPGPRWRVFAVTPFIGLELGVMADASAHALPVHEYGGVVSPLHFLAPIAPVASAVTGVVLFPTFLGVLASVVVRFVRARATERQQLKLFMFAAVGSAAFVAAMTFAFPGPMERGLGIVVWEAPIVLLPAAATFAVLRHGLYEIDRVISRTVSYVVITAFLAGMFALVVLVPTAVIGASGQTPSWLVAIATLLVAFLFQPVRRRVQGRIDRRFNRARYDAERTIDDFAARLRDEVDIDTLKADVRDVVGRTMQPAHVSIWVAKS